MKCWGCFCSVRKFICLMVNLFDGRSSGSVFGISVKIMLCRLEKVKLKLEETNTFILPGGELFKFFGGICNIVIKISILWEAEFISGSSYIKRREICFKVGVSAKKFFGLGIGLRRIFLWI